MNLFEVIVVDDGSTDDTRTTIREYMQHSKLNLKYVYQEHAGPGVTRNYGITQSSGAIVAFLDDDVILRDDCFEHAIAHFAQPDVAVVEAMVLIEGTSEPLLKYSAVQGFITNCIFYRKRVLEEIGGFDEAFFDSETGLFFRDDLDLGFRLLEAGHRAVQPHDVVVWHPMIYNNLKSCFNHARRYMFDPLLYRKHPKLFRAQLERKQIGFFSFGRPLHYASLGYLSFQWLVVILLLMKLPFAAGLAAIVMLVNYFVIRYKYKGRRALRLWNLTETLAYAMFPWYYGYWFVRGCRKFGGWKSIV